MFDGPTTEGAAEGGLRIGRRGFIGASLAVAGAGLILPNAAGAADAAAGPDGTSVAGAAASNGSSVAQARSGSSRISQIPLLWRIYPNVPAIPVDVAGSIETIARLALRSQQTTQAKQGLTEMFTINGTTDVAYAFLFGGSAATLEDGAGPALAKFLQERPDKVLSELFSKPLQTGRPALLAAQTTSASKPLPLESPEQFSISWTTFPDVYQSALPKLREWASSLSDADAATEQFWPTIAQARLRLQPDHPREGDRRDGHPRAPPLRGDLA